MSNVKSLEVAAEKKRKDIEEAAEGVLVEAKQKAEVAKKEMKKVIEGGKSLEAAAEKKLKDIEETAEGVLVKAKKEMKKVVQGGKDRP